MKIDHDYRPLEVAFWPGHSMSDREEQVVKTAVQAWGWVDPWRRTNLLPLIVLTTANDPDVLIRFDDDLGMTDPDPNEPDRMIAPKLGITSTPLYGVGPTHVILSRKIFTEVDPTNWSKPVKHELGHALGLVHDDGGIMYPHIDTTATIITQRNREKAAALRKDGVVGVTSLKGN